MNSSHQRARPLSTAVIYAVLALWSLACLFPLYWMAIASIKAPADLAVAPHYVPFVDFTPSLEAWNFILFDQNENLKLMFWNSAVVGVVSTLATILLGSLAAYGLSRFRYAIPYGAAAAGVAAVVSLLLVFAVDDFGMRAGCAIAAAALAVVAVRQGHGARRHSFGNRELAIALLATRLLPPVVLVLPIYLMALRTGTLDTVYALIATHTATNLPVALWLLLPVFGPRATQQEEAAELDGASRLRVFLEIAVPMAAGGILVAALLIFTLSWNEYLYAAYLAGDQAMTLPPWMVGQMSIKEAQTGSEAEEWAHLSAAAVFMALPLLALTGFAQRALTARGLWRS